jgi:hypothetical protein
MSTQAKKQIHKGLKKPRYKFNYVTAVTIIIENRAVIMMQYLTGTTTVFITLKEIMLQNYTDMLLPSIGMCVKYKMSFLWFLH